ncbi:hypothetical protein PG991_013151, partial [Apiospora marii]
HLEEQPGGSLPESVRVSALEAARDLVASLEKPQDALIRFAQSYREGLYGATPYTKEFSKRTAVGTVKFL